MVRAIQGRQHASRSIDLLEVGKIVPGSEVHAPAPVYPVIGLAASQKQQGLGKGRFDLEYGAVLLRQGGKESGNVAAPKVPVECQLAKRHGRDVLSQGRAPKQGTSNVVGDRSGHGPADYVHLTNEINARLCLFIELEHEAKDIARVDEADNDDVSRGRNFVVKNCLADARLDELYAGTLRGTAARP